MSRKRPKRMSWSSGAVSAHMEHHHPSCPAGLRAKFAEEIGARKWDPPVTLGQAVGNTLHNFVRHNLTDYDALLRLPGITREEARLIVAGEVAAITSAWARIPTPKTGSKQGSDQVSQASSALAHQTSAKDR